ncbi:hypothetical protein F2Q70_00036162 [Brassica cretica]|uniref:Uncharacterized protein n=1 Tax=Brassica cretica TaxID=69181 RepID=A0A8S9JWQ5_BRACR|nr:hypothetical protein F2Q70_00036162 [Brassica cretica]
MNPEFLMFPSSLVGGLPRPRRPFTDPFSSPVPSWGDVPEADSEAVPMAPLRRRRYCFFDDGPRSEIREGDLANMRRKYAIHPSVGMRSPTEFEHAPDGGAGEVAVYEAYLEAGFWGVIPSLIGEVSSFFSLCPSQLTPPTWRTLMAIQLLGKLHGFSAGVHEILYSYYFAPLVNKAVFYHLQSRYGTPLVEEPSRGVRGNYPFRDGWNSRYVFVKIQEPVGYPTSWRTVGKCFPPGFLCWRSGSEAYNGNSLTILMDDLSGNAARLPVSVVYDEYQKAKARKRRPSYTPLPRLARAALSANGLSSTSSTSVEVGPNRDPLVVAHRRLIGEVFLLRGQMQDMVARWDLLVQQVKAVGKKYSMKRLLQLPSSRSLPPGFGFLPLGPGSLPPGLGPCPQVWVPAPRSGSLPPGLGPCPQVWVLHPVTGPGPQVWELPPSSMPSDFSCRKINRNLPFIR